MSLPAVSPVTPSSPKRLSLSHTWEVFNRLTRLGLDYLRLGEVNMPTHTTTPSPKPTTTEHQARHKPSDRPTTQPTQQQGRNNSRTTRKPRTDAHKAHKRRKARAHARAEATRQRDCDRLQALPLCNPHVAGIDIGDQTHWVCVGFTASDQDDNCVRAFATHSEGLRHIVAWLREQQVTKVAMEATGVYWIPLFELLAQEGFEPILVPTQYTRQVQGRPKTDKRDCQWIYRLHSVGLLPGAFRPDQATTILRSYLRQRANLIRDAARHILRMQKALQQMNLKLTTVVSDITGVTGRRIIQAILRGTRDPHKLALLRHPKCQQDVTKFAQALDGTYREEHLFALRQAHQAWQFYQKQLDDIDEMISKQLERMKRSSPLPPLPPGKRRGGPKANDLRFNVREALYYVVGLDLTELEGVSENTALTLISELGTDLSAFKTVKHFCSWLGLCPQHRKTGGKVKSSSTRGGLSRAASTLRLAASSLHCSPTALGAYLRRMKSRLGAPAAVTATAHKLARLVYYALKHGLAYVRQTQTEYEAAYRQRQIEELTRKARRLGLEVKSTSSEVAAGVNGERGAEATLS